MGFFCCCRGKPTCACPTIIVHHFSPFSVYLPAAVVRNMDKGSSYCSFVPQVRKCRPPSLESRSPRHRVIFGRKKLLEVWEAREMMSGRPPRFLASRWSTPLLSLMICPPGAPVKSHVVSPRGSAGGPGLAGCLLSGARKHSLILFLGHCNCIALFPTAFLLPSKSRPRTLSTAPPFRTWGRGAEHPQERSKSESTAPYWKAMRV